MSGQLVRDPVGWDDRPCLGTDLHLWYGPGEGEPEECPSERRWREDVAKRVCAACPVIGHCLSIELALPLDDQWGVRGGMTAQERREMIRARRRAA